ncbi:MAG: type II toxin-antitoxin system PemK/MazF family toxin [Tagaea sp.]
MAINEHPAIGTILICDFDRGFVAPEMVKRRPVVVVSPKISVRYGLCTVVPISTEVPSPKMPYHLELGGLQPPLPEPWDQGPNWIKGDMIYSVSFNRLDFIRYGKNSDGKRVYRFETLSSEQMKSIRKCMLSALGLVGLTQHL